MERTLSIGQLAAATGLGAKTIRYYEEMGVLPSPCRNAAGYRQYGRRDVHRALFIRRARALGFPLGKLKALSADLGGRPSRMMRPRLEQLVTERLHVLREQVIDFRVLEQQLEQVLQRLRTMPSAKHSEACRCLDGAATPTPRETPALSHTRKREGADMSPDATLEAVTRLAAASNGDSDCGCSCGELSAERVNRPDFLRFPLRVIASAEKGIPGRSRPDRGMDSRVRRR